MGVELFLFFCLLLSQNHLLPMDEIHVFKEIVRLIKEDKLDQSLKMISKKLMNDCMGLIYKNTRLENPHEAMNLFYDAFLTFAHKVQSGSFLYEGEKQTEGYFKTSCVFKAKEYKRGVYNQPEIIPIDLIEKYADEFDNEYENQRNKLQQEYMEYAGLDIWGENEKENLKFNSLVPFFHQLEDECKFIIFLKHIIGLSHEEIADKLGLFYQIGNSDVSKTTLNRCMNELRRMVYN
jgi:hypothetical protein